MKRLDIIRREFWRAPDQSLTDAGRAGELLAAQMRFLIAAGVFVSPLLLALRADTRSGSLLPLAGAGLFLLLATLIWVYGHRGGRGGWFPFVTGVVDVTAVSAVAAGALILNNNAATLDSRLLFPAYFLALAATCLRYDVRVTIVTGFLAIVQYLAICFGAARIVGASGTAFPWPDHIGRLMILGAATVLSAAIVWKGRRLRLLSTHDTLTGLYNRAYFDERVAEELHRAQRYTRPLSIGVLDIDNFKAVNDRHGHAGGDECLRRFAHLLRTSFRRTDVVARYGGEEFAIAMPETDAAESEAKIERIRKLVEATPIRLSNGETVRLTFSAGIAHHPDDGDHSVDLFELGDTNLLSAKRTGRNRIITRKTKTA